MTFRNSPVSWRIAVSNRRNDHDHSIVVHSRSSDIFYGFENKSAWPERYLDIFRFLFIVFVGLELISNKSLAQNQLVFVI